MKHFFSRRFVILIFVLLLFTGPGSVESGTFGPASLPPAGPVPDGVLRVMTWNVAHGRAEAFHQAFVGREVLRGNLAEIARVIEREGPHVTALQEADGPSAWSGGFDHVGLLAELTATPHQVRGDHNPFGLAGRALDAGTALVSRLPLGDATSEPFGLSPWDTKGYVVAAVPVPGTGRTVDVVSVHLDPVDPVTRRNQVESLVATLRERSRLGRPLVVMGDLNCEDGERALEMLEAELDLAAYRTPEVSGTSLATFPASAPLRRIDWILTSSDLEIVEQRVLPDRLSDHLAVVADI
jgi:endonuclease/exonuclease/phosphatase family metal-dependent hydrolase